MPTFDKITQFTTELPLYNFRTTSSEPKPSGSYFGKYSTLDEMDTGKRFFYNGEEWVQMPANSGGSLPANFPPEAAANANKFVGFDSSGNYSAKDAPSGGVKDTPGVILTLTVPTMIQQGEDLGYMFSAGVDLSDLTDEQKAAIDALYENDYALFWNDASKKMRIQYFEDNVKAYLLIENEAPKKALLIGEESGEKTISILTVTDVSGAELSLFGYQTKKTDNVFDFTISTDGGTLSANAGTGVSYAAIKAVLDANDSAYAKCDFGGGVYVKLPFLSETTTAVCAHCASVNIANGGNIPVIYQLNVKSDNSVDFAMETIS